MAFAQEKLYTIEDIYALPEGTRAELIDGQLYMMAPPSRRHQEIAGMLYRKIADYIDSKEGSCKTYIAPFAVFLNADNSDNRNADTVCAMPYAAQCKDRFRLTRCVSGFLPRAY